MKRRDFLATSAGLAGTLVPVVGRTQVKPCTAPTLNAASGNSTASNCGVVGAAADWQARSVAPGVVWAHDFSDSREVDQFRHGSNSQADGYQYNRIYQGPGATSAYGDGNCRWVANDDQTGRPCLELNIPASPAAITVDRISNDATAVFTTTAPHNLLPGDRIYFRNLAGGSWASINETYGGASGIYKPTFTVLSVPSSTSLTCRGNGSNDSGQFANVAVDGSSLGTYSTGSGRVRQHKSSDAGWWRPFSPLTATASGSTIGNGKSTPDHACGGTLTRRSTWNAAGLNAGYNWRDGYFAHPDYSSVCDTWQGGSGKYLGHDFWLQFRVKMSAGRFDPANDGLYGKLVFVGTTAETPLHEIVVRTNSKPVDGAPSVGGAIFSMYTGQGNDYRLVSPYRAPGANGMGYLQPGGAYQNAQCQLTNSTTTLSCWEWPANEWVVVLMHVVPGHSGRDSTNGDTGVQVWVAKQSELARGYVKIHDKLDYWFTYGASYHPITAFNSFLPTSYMNGQPANVAWTHRFDQIILSKQMIPCPTV